jgi:Skp family chaperone for outer membrane proteins
MKQFVALVGLLLLSAGSAAWSQETPAEIIQRREIEDSIKELKGKIADLETATQSFQKQIDKLEQELARLREELSSTRNNNATAALEERVKRLSDSITEVDKKRQADNEKLTQYIEKSFSRLEKSISVPPPPRPSASPPSSPSKTGPGGNKAAAPSGNEKVLEYTVQPGDTLSGIVAKVRKEAGLKVTQKQVMDVNPNVNWNRLQVRQKIYIPALAQ